MLRRLLLTLTLSIAALVAVASPAQALNPEQTLTGSSQSRWYSGSLIQQYGTNCSTAVLGSSYAEVMTSAVGGYGGTTGIVGVGNQYWASLLMSVPGNPCGPGSAGIQTDLFLPPGTRIDTTRAVRCFYLLRGNSDTANGWIDGTNEGWALQGVGSGRLCPDSVGPSTLSAGGHQIGYRLVPSGMLFKIFVPVISDQPLSGASGQVFDWLLASSAAYENPALTRTNAYVFSVGGNTPQVFFSRQPAAAPYWSDGKPDNQANRVELFMNLYTAGQAGNISYEIRRTDTNGVVWSSALAGGTWNGAVAPGQSLLQVTATGDALGPNGGYSPVFFDPPGTPSNPAGEWNVPMRITWTFTPNSGSPVSASSDFRTLAGPDTDGDGVVNASDACPAAKGNGADGCTAVQATSDSDLDGVNGAADACPTVSAPGTADGCPAGQAPQGPVGGGGGVVAGNPPATPAPLVTVKKGSTLKRSQLTSKKGAAFTLTCTAGASLSASIVATKSSAKALKIKGKQLPELASGKATCAAGQTKLTLKAIKKRASALKKAKGKLPATLVLTATGPGGTTKASASVKLG